VALPVAVGARFVENAWPDATVTKVLVRAGRSTNSGCLLEAELDKVLYAFNFLILTQTTLLEVGGTKLSVALQGQGFSGFLSGREERLHRISSHARSPTTATFDTGSC
jgi:hypothetical protein